ncbi:hypothetical protein Hamer_G003163 [Homarus americanus]|uniref:Uncharacterized protein n=1 Tax=Homarus americanus TaxID=6706 RepID=A0A8J5N6W6_HOMAM|nr:hypothetical protein Hamer_G003163 [Homarus americanus]
MWHLINKVAKKNPSSALHHSPAEYAQDLVDTWSEQSQAHNLTEHIQEALSCQSNLRTLRLKAALLKVDEEDTVEITEEELRHAIIRGSMESTRSKTEVWLIGQHITEITGAQLPSRGDVLRLFFHGHNEHKKTVNDSASEVAASVISFWNKARIPTITEKSIGRKVVDLFLMWKGLKKNCTRTTDTQRKKEETFCDELEDLFDVAHPKAMQLLTIKEDRAFLAAQREKGRRGVMAGVDKKIACSIKRREESKSKQSLQQNQASSALEYDELGSSSETESQSSSSSSTSSLAISPVVSSSNRKRATLKVITPELSSTLDRTGISHRSALRIVSATAASLVAVPHFSGTATTSWPLSWYYTLVLLVPFPPSPTRTTTSWPLWCHYAMALVVVHAPGHRTMLLNVNISIQGSSAGLS